MNEFTIQLRLHTFCLIWASNDIIYPSFKFPPSYDDFCRLLITTSIDHWVARTLLVYLPFYCISSNKLPPPPFPSALIRFLISQERRLFEEGAYFKVRKMSNIKFQNHKFSPSKSKYQQYFRCFIVCILFPYAFWFNNQQNIVEYRIYYAALIRGEALISVWIPKVAALI